GAALVDFAIAFVALGVFLMIYGIAPTYHLLLLPLLIAATALLALGVGMWLSALNVKYRDVRYALPFLIQIWMFVSPIIYPPDMIPNRWRSFLWLNPLFGL